MVENLSHYFTTLRNFSRLFMQDVVNDGRSANPDLKLSQIKAIAAFQDKNCFSMKELANNIGVKLSNMTMMVDSLIKDGMVERGRDESDRRKVMVCLTPKGKKTRDKFLAQRRKMAKSIIANLDKQDKDELLKSMDKACQLLEKSIKKKTLYERQER
jgi:DNA-binding MarR family transcriptional regulator